MMPRSLLLRWVTFHELGSCGLAVASLVDSDFVRHYHFLAQLETHTRLEMVWDGTSNISMKLRSMKLPSGQQQ